MSNKIRFGLWGLLAAVYLIVRFGFTQQLDAMGTYASYIFEVVCVVVGFALYAERATLFGFNRVLAILSVVALAAGFGIYKFAQMRGIVIPFDLKGTETIVFLLVVAPILEEAIFRFFLWKPLIKPALAFGVTTALFAYSHFHAMWFVPPELAPFIEYQTLYTFGLALVCGFSMLRYNSLLGAILIHFGFNLGFYLASLA